LEIRGSLRTVPSRPVALAMAVLAVLALALTAWFVLGTHAQSSSQGTTRAPATNQLPLDCTSDPYSPHDPLCKPYHDPYSPHDPIPAP